MKTQRAVRPPYCGSRPGAPTTKGGAQHGHCRAGTLPARERCLLRVPSHHSARNQISRMQVKRNVSRCFFCELALPANIPAPQCRVVRSNHRMTLTKVSCPRSSATPAPMHPSASGRDLLYTSKHSQQCRLTCPLPPPTAGPCFAGLFRRGACSCAVCRRRRRLASFGAFLGPVPRADMPWIYGWLVSI